MIDIKGLLTSAHISSALFIIVIIMMINLFKKDVKRTNK